MPILVHDAIRLARIECELSQEAAAEKLFLSRRQLQDMERGLREPDRLTIGRMVDLYKKPMLAVQYVHAEAAPVGLGELFPEGETSVELASMRFFNALRAFIRRERVEELLQLAEDGKISAEERPAFDELVSEFECVVRAFIAVRTAGREGQT